jgi:enoyl-CoA hydratase
MSLARTIASKSGRALRLAKQSLNGIELLDVKTSYRFEQGFTLELYTSPDSQEARDAFVDKRDAKFEPPSKS